MTYPKISITAAKIAGALSETGMNTRFCQLMISVKHPIATSRSASEIALVLSRDTSKKQQDGLESVAIYKVQAFLNKIGRIAQILGMYRYNNWSIY
ncbi:MAG: hypothetical protein KME50_38065 [Nostoc desertorum CM1-VF14]|nr:hypothetical protein [Nostoc desertorum CM1-VF14]